MKNQIVVLAAEANVNHATEVVKNGGKEMHQLVDNVQMNEAEARQLKPTCFVTDGRPYIIDDGDDCIRSCEVDDDGDLTDCPLSTEAQLETGLRCAKEIVAGMKYHKENCYNQDWYTEMLAKTVAECVVNQLEGFMKPIVGFSIIDAKGEILGTIEGLHALDGGAGYKLYADMGNLKEAGQPWALSEIFKITNCQEFIETFLSSNFGLIRAAVLASDVWKADNQSN